MRIVRAALAYWAVIFALGVVLGTGRTLWLAPQVGAVGAVALELPVMLAASWLWARRVVRRHALGSGREGLAAGGLALTLLLAAELALARGLGGQSAGQWAAGLAMPPGALGLAGQAIFALFPALARRTRGST